MARMEKNIGLKRFICYEFYLYMLISQVLWSCKTDSRKVTVSHNDTNSTVALVQSIAPVTLEYLVQAHIRDSVDELLRSRSIHSFKTDTPLVYYYFPVKIASFVGLLEYTARGSFFFESDDWSKRLLKSTGNSFEEYRQPVYYHDYLRFVDSLSRYCYTISRTSSDDTSSAEVLFRPNVNQYATYGVEYTDHQIRMIISSLHRSNK